MCILKFKCKLILLKGSIVYWGKRGSGWIEVGEGLNAEQIGYVIAGKGEWG